MYRSRTIGISTDYNYLTKENFADYRKSGIGAFELCMEEEAHYMELDFKKIVSVADSEGVCAWSFHLPYYYFEGAVISEIDEKRRKNSVKFQSELIKKAADSGFQYAIIHPSGEPNADEDRPFAMESAQHSIAELSEVAEQNGIVLAVENLPRSCLGNCSEEILDLLTFAPKARVCFDTNHLLNETPEEFLIKVSHKIASIHISDYDFADERHWLPGEGRVDWKNFMDKLDIIDYDGKLIYEVPRSRSAITTIARERDLVPADYRRNADELFSRSELTKLGKVI